MKNYEKYLEEIIDSLGISGMSCYFIHRRVFHEETCNDRDCVTCNKRVKEWLKEEYNPQIDWSKVPVDTPVIVISDGGVSYCRHFAKFENNEIYVFNAGATSWTSPNSPYAFTKWNETKLAREEDIEKYSI